MAPFQNGIFLPARWLNVARTSRRDKQPHADVGQCYGGSGRGHHRNRTSHCGCHRYRKPAQPVCLSATADATNWFSSNPNVLAVSSSGLITGVGVGSATVSATVGGVTAVSGSITVSPQTLLHRYSFVSDASDSVGGSAWNGTLVPQGAGTAASITANGLNLPGGGGGDYSGYVSLPDGILTNTTSVTVECWATQASANQWATLWAFAVEPGVNFALIPNPSPAIENNGQMVVAVNPN